MQSCQFPGVKKCSVDMLVFNYSRTILVEVFGQKKKVTVVEKGGYGGSSSQFGHRFNLETKNLTSITKLPYL